METGCIIRNLGENEMNKARNAINGQYISKKQKQKAMPDVDVPKVIDIWFGGDEPEKQPQEKPYLDELVEFTRNVILIILLMVVTIYIGVRI
jgi:hypothetical protein